MKSKAKKDNRAGKTRRAGQAKAPRASVVNRRRKNNVLRKGKQVVPTRTPGKRVVGNVDSAGKGNIDLGGLTSRAASTAPEYGDGIGNLSMPVLPIGWHFGHATSSAYFNFLRSWIRLAYLLWGRSAQGR